MRARIGSGLGRLRWWLGSPFRWLWDWWSGIPDEGQVALVGMLLLGGGAALVWLPAGLIASGLTMTAISMGFNLHDRAVAVVFVVIAGLAVIAAIVVGGAI